MTKIMSISLIVCLLYSNHVICSENMTLEQKIALQKERLELCDQMGSFHEQQESKKQKKLKKQNRSLSDDTDIKQHVYDFIGNHESMSLTVEEDSLIRFLPNTSHGHAVVSVSPWVKNIAIQFQENACHNSVVLDMPFNGQQNISWCFEKGSSHNDLEMFAFNIIGINSADYSGHNAVRVYSPLRKLMMPALLIAMLYGGYKIFFSE